jgi:hypothetical protein
MLGAVLLWIGSWRRFEPRWTQGTYFAGQGHNHEIVGRVTAAGKRLTWAGWGLLFVGFGLQLVG